MLHQVKIVNNDLTLKNNISFRLHRIHLFADHPIKTYDELVKKAVKSIFARQNSVKLHVALPTYRLTALPLEAKHLKSLDSTLHL